jgi:predicted transposase YbfD/YdcC
MSLSYIAQTTTKLYNPFCYNRVGSGGGQKLFSSNGSASELKHDVRVYFQTVCRLDTWLCDVNMIEDWQKQNDAKFIKLISLLK